MDLDKEQQEVLDYEGSCVVIGPPGTGKTEIFNAKGERCKGTAAFLPFTRAARQELRDRVLREGLFPKITIATINSFCQGHLEGWPGSFGEQLSKFLALEEKPQYNLVGIDEVQDLRPLHFEVAKAVQEDLLFAGGDPYQTIFTFGDAMGFEIFEKLNELGCKTFYLHSNYRSGKWVVDLLNYIYPREIEGKGPKTYDRSAVFTRTHQALGELSGRLENKGIAHTLRLRSGRDKEVLGGNSLYLMVTHACKGLGFDTVYQYDWYLPSRSTRPPEEETNLLYVSVARASKDFFLVGSSGSMYCLDYFRGSNLIQLTEAEMVRMLL